MVCFINTRPGGLVRLHLHPDRYPVMPDTCQEFSSLSRGGGPTRCVTGILALFAIVFFSPGVEAQGVPPSYVNSQGIRMVLIKRGAFEMGNNQATDPAALMRSPVFASGGTVCSRGVRDPFLPPGPQEISSYLVSRQKDRQGVSLGCPSRCWYCTPRGYLRPIAGTAMIKVSLDLPVRYSVSRPCLNADRSYQFLRKAIVGSAAVI